MQVLSPSQGAEFNDVFAQRVLARMGPAQQAQWFLSGARSWQQYSAPLPGAGCSSLLALLRSMNVPGWHPPHPPAVTSIASTLMSSWQPLWKAARELVAIQ
jgi:hypothetical protein